MEDDKLTRSGLADEKSSMGKVSGCLLGIGITLTIAWTILKL